MLHNILLNRDEGEEIWKMSYMFLGNLDLSNFMQISFKHSMIFLIFPVIELVFEEHHWISDLILLFGLSSKLRVLQNLCPILTVLLTLCS